MDTCQFSFISKRTYLEVTARGVERSWDDLKIECDRSGPGIPGATYYKRLGTAGPELFAVLDENQVFYHDAGEWHKYITARNVRFGQQVVEAYPTKQSRDIEDMYGVEDS
jgi:hypothetical protein